MVQPEYTQRVRCLVEFRVGFWTVFETVGSVHRSLAEEFLLSFDLSFAEDEPT